MHSAPHPTFLSVSDFLKEVPIGRTLLYDMMRLGKVRRVKFGARTVIPSMELTRFVEVDNRNVAVNDDYQLPVAAAELPSNSLRC